MSTAPARGGRPALALLERILQRSFRPERYHHLLAEHDLPEQPPDELAAQHGPAYAANAWEALREMQWWYRLAAAGNTPQDEADRIAIAREFSWLVHHLHGGRRPAWYTERLGVDQP